MTFQYADGAVLGLAKHNKAILVVASGGVFTGGPWRSWDFVEPYLHQVPAFIDITDVQTVCVRGQTSPAWRRAPSRGQLKLFRSLPFSAARAPGTGPAVWG
ncbi:NAD(P)H-dependent oxidoreductase [Roseixanthobacter pseudopolyaromaticivorans]|uniref:NAD(P)H-dependent oxidoreductase n=1 Tax=Xanthobacteraceae TaxID=335928 RepID=UPI00372C505B